MHFIEIFNNFREIFFQGIHVDETGVDIRVVVFVVGEVVISVVNKAVRRVQLDYHAQTEIVVFEIVSLHLIENLKCFFVLFLFQQSFYNYVEKHLILFNLTIFNYLFIEGHCFFYFILIKESFYVNWISYKVFFLNFTEEFFSFRKFVAVNGALEESVKSNNIRISILVLVHVFNQRLSFWKVFFFRVTLHQDSV